MLERLLVHRLRDTADEVQTSEIRAVLAGGAVSPARLRRLAPVLDLHVADLFVIAGLDLDEELLPASTTPWNVGSVLRTAATFTRPSLRQLDEFVRSLPEHPPAPPPGGQGSTDPREPGALLVNLLRNRNIRPHNAQMLLLIGDGPYVSDSTIAMLGRGRVTLTPQYVTAFAAVLGIPDTDLAAMTGVAPAADAWTHPYRAELVALAWHARRLTSDQLSQAMTFATELWRTDRHLPFHRCQDHHPAIRCTQPGSSP